jgi:tetratricopeptide (TPR) repeat protein
MLRLCTVIAVCALFANVAYAQGQDEPPPQCRYDTSGNIDHAACLEASPASSLWRSLALINLGTDAFQRGDYAAAIKYYDEARPTNGDDFYSDASYHAYHAATLDVVGRRDEAIAEARRALAVLRNAPELPEEVRRRFGSVNVDVELVYAAILPVLHSAGDPQAASVREAFLALPARDWVSWVNRAGVLEIIGDVAGGLQANAEALRLQPGHPAVLNNQCYLLARADRASEAMPYCDSALAVAPEISQIWHSRATVLAALGRCEESARDLAEARRRDPASQTYRQPIACSAH